MLLAGKLQKQRHKLKSSNVLYMHETSSLSHNLYDHKTPTNQFIIYHLLKFHCEECCKNCVSEDKTALNIVEIFVIYL